MLVCSCRENCLSKRLLRTRIYIWACILISNGTYWCPDALGGQEYIDNAAISQKWDGPKQEKYNTEEIHNEGMLWGESSPVGMNHTLQVLREVVQMRGPWGKRYVKFLISNYLRFMTFQAKTRCMQMNLSNQSVAYSQIKVLVNIGNYWKNIFHFVSYVSFARYPKSSSNTRANVK